MSLFGGMEEEKEQISNLTPQQLFIEKQRRAGARNAFTKSSNYWKDILNDNPDSFKAYEAPAQRQFQEEIMPDLAEQYAGMGAGNLSSSGFRNASLQAGVGLSERLAAMRAGLKENAAANLYNLGNASLTPHSQWGTTQEASPGFMQTALPIAGAVVGGIYGGPAGAGAGYTGGTALANLGSNNGGSPNGGNTSPFGTAPGIFGKSNPYGNGAQGINGMSNAVQQAV